MLSFTALVTFVPTSSCRFLVVQREDRALFDQDLFCFCKLGKTLGLIRHCCAVFDDLIVLFCLFAAPSVLSCTCFLSEALQHGIRIIIISGSSIECNVKVSIIELIPVRTGLIGGDRKVQIQVLFPHCLHRLCNQFQLIIIFDHNLICCTCVKSVCFCFFQQLFCSVYVIGNQIAHNGTVIFIGTIIGKTCRDKSCG